MSQLHSDTVETKNGVCDVRGHKREMKSKASIAMEYQQVYELL